MLESFAKLHHEKLDFKLLLGGYGEELEKMKNFIEEQGFSGKVAFLGKMTKKQIATTLQKSDAYLFSSTYETFSVVCAQALMCGVPLVGPKLSAIEEYADGKSYLALEENNVNEWIENIKYFIKHRYNYHREEISLKANTYLANENIAKQYMEILDEWFK
jgi:glycosyltransferase involved in cell wall biosynthesis